MRRAVTDRSPVVDRSRLASFTSAEGTSPSSLARRVALGAVVLAVVACTNDAPTDPTHLAAPTAPELVLTGGVGTRIFPVVTPGEFQPIGFAVGLNNAGQVTGTGRLLSSDDQNKPYRWTPGQGAVKLLGCCDTQYGVDINDAGVVVGSAQTTAVVGWRGFVATGTNMVSLSILPGASVEGDAHAYAVNASNQIVGVSVAPGSGVRHAVMWSSAGVIQDLGTLGGSRSEAIDINASAQVIGKSLLAGDAVTHFFLWSPGTGMQDLNVTVDPNITSVVEINDAGQIVGTYVNGNGHSHAFLFTPGSGLRDLGTLGGTSSEPTGLNGKGDVVGSSVDGNGATHAFLWTAGDGIEDVTAVTGVPEVRRLNDNLQTLTGTAPPTDILMRAPGAQPRLIQLDVTQSDSPPTAIFTWSCNGLTCTLDATGSLDDNPGLTYSWDLNKYPDGSATGAIVTVTYPHANPRTVTLTVTDSKEQTSTSTQTIPVTDYPIAAFTFSCSGLTCTFDSSGSTNGGNPITRRIWYFGDGQSDVFDRTNITHTYAAAGTYSVRLEVWGADHTVRGVLTQQVTVTAAPANLPPIANFTFSCSSLTCSFDASGSTDDHGIVSYVWDLNKYPGGSATGPTATATYPHSGMRYVTLTVTDADGLSNSITEAFDPSVNTVDMLPVARFTWSCTGTVCTLDASTSSDDVGITAYAWTLGKTPGGTDTGETVTTDYWHTSTRTVTLTVTDTKGQTDTVSHTFMVP